MTTFTATKIKPELLESSDLQYVYAHETGITRRKKGKGFCYINPNGETVTDTKTRERLDMIAVPPTYTDVWYCAHANGHLQATGYDSNSKKQYFYHPEWERLRTLTKFSSLENFGEALPSLRNVIARNIKDTHLDKQTVICAMLRILDRTGMRIGNEHASTLNDTYGLTTLRTKHVDLDQNTLHFHYNGKGGGALDKYMSDAKVAEIVDQCAEIGGQRLFEYEDDKGAPHIIDSADVNMFLKQHMGNEFSAKDFRTWRFSCLFLEMGLKRKDHDPSLKDVLEDVANVTGNTPAILQSSYVHPALIRDLKKKNLQGWEIQTPQKNGLRKFENYFLNFLKSNHK